MNPVETPDVDKADAAVRARMQDSLDDLEPYSAAFPSTHGGDVSAIMVAETPRRRSAKRSTSTKIQRTPAALILTHFLTCLLPIDVRSRTGSCEPCS
jgi:hypothetical protein